MVHSLIAKITTIDRQRLGFLHSFFTCFFHGGPKQNTCCLSGDHGCSGSETGKSAYAFRYLHQIVLISTRLLLHRSGILPAGIRATQSNMSRLRRNSLKEEIIHRHLYKGTWMCDNQFCLQFQRLTVNWSRNFH